MRPTCLFLRSKRRLPLSCSCHFVPFPSLFVSTVQSPPPTKQPFPFFPSLPLRTAAQTLQQHEPRPTEQNKKKKQDVVEDCAAICPICDPSGIHLFSLFIFSLFHSHSQPCNITISLLLSHLITFTSPLPFRPSTHQPTLVLHHHQW